jgi:2-keto-4-pentenoate hydratase
MQVASQITECDCGTLFDGMLLRDGSGFEAARHTVLRLELELDFVLARALAERL